MSADALPANLRDAAPALAQSLRALVAGLAAVVAHAFLRHPRHAALIVPLWTRLTRAGRRFERAMARLLAGIAPRPPRPGRAGGASPAKFPNRHAWLVVAIGYQAAAYKSRLAHLLSRPDTAALLAASPQAARILRPLCRMLGLRPEMMGPCRAILAPKPPPRPAPRRARRPEPPPPAPYRPPVFITATSPPAPLPPWVPDGTPDWKPPRVEPPCPRLANRWPWVPHPNAKPARPPEPDSAANIPITE